MLLVTSTGRAGELHTSPLDLHFQIATMAMMASQVLPLPLALGLGVVVERGPVGFEAGFHVDAATICDSNEGGNTHDGFCGLLLTAEAGPRLRWPAARGWSPYLSARGQWLRMTRGDAGSLAIAPRVGASFQGDRFGGFAEAGTSIVVGDGKDDWRLIGTGGRTLPVLVAGMRF